MLSPTIKVKARRREGGAAGEGKRFRRSRFFFHRKRRRPRMAYGASYLKGTRFFDRRGMIAGPSPYSQVAFSSSPRSALPIGIAAFGLCLPFLIKNSGSARESAGNNWKEGVHVAAVSAPFLVNGAQQVRHLLQKRESTSDNHVSARQRVEWPRADLFGYIIQVESRVTGKAVWWKTTFTFGSESTFFVENSSFPFVWIPQRRISNLWGPIYSISRAPKKTPYPSDSIYLLTLSMWVSMRVHRCYEFIFLWDFSLGQRMNYMVFLRNWKFIATGMSISNDDAL